MEAISAKLSEAIEIGAELGDVEIQAEAMQWHVAALIGARRPRDGPPRARGRRSSSPADRRQPFLLHVGEHYRSAIALADGRLDDADAAAQRSHEWSRLLTGRDASGVYGVQMFNIRREQGRLGGLAPVVRVLARESAGAWQPGFAALLTDLRLEDEARDVLGAILRARARPPPPGPLAGIARPTSPTPSRGSATRASPRPCTPSSSPSPART